MGNVIKKKDNYSFDLIYKNKSYEIMVQRQPFWIRTKDTFFLIQIFLKKQE